MHRSYKESHQSVDLVPMFAPVDEVVGAGRDPGRGAGDGAQGVQARADRAARRGLPRRPRGRRGGRRPGRRRPRCAVNVPATRRPVAGPDRARGRRSCASAQQPDRARRPRRRPRRRVRRGACASPRRLGIPVATTFHGKGVFPDDHPLALGAVGFMRHDYVNFGFDQRRRDRRGRVRAAGVRPGTDQPARRHQDHPRPPLPRRGRRALRRGGRAPRRHRPQPRRARRRGRRRDRAARRRPASGSGTCSPTSSTRGRADDRFPACTGADRRRHPRGAGPRRHRARRHRRAEDVDGAALPDLRAEHLPDLQRPVDDGVDGARARSPRRSPGRRRRCSSRPATARS